MSPHHDHRAHHLTPDQRMQLRDACAMRALPFCLLDAEKADPTASKTAKAELASSHAYLIADQMLAQR